MNENNIQQLIKIYNTLLQVHTCGEDSFVYTDCMRALLSIIKNNANEKQELKEKE